MDRRTIIQLLATAPVLPLLSSASADTPDPPSGIPPSLPPGLLQDDTSARIIGKRLLMRRPDRPEPAQLLADTGLDPTWSPEHMRAVLIARRVLDFSAGQTVEVDGWVLARCEAALCLLLTLAPANDG